MGVYIVTGLKGQEHVTSADDGAFNAGIVGTGKYVMKTAEQFAAEIVSNNIVRIKSGDLVNQGRHIRIEVNDYEDMTIENGAQSVKRNDLIVMRYKKDTSTTIELESAELVVIKGIAGATATDPTYTSGDILAGATQDDFPLYRVSLNGLNIEKVTPLFSTVPNLNELNTKISDYKVINVKAVAPFQIEGNVVQIGKIVIVNLTVAHSQSNTKYIPKQNDLFVTGLPVPAEWVKVMGVHFYTISEPKCTQVVSCIIRTVDGVGALSSWYPNTEYINKSSGVSFNFSYIAKE